MKTLVLASRNEGKIEELRATLAPLNINLTSALEYPELKEVTEDRDTLEGNAIKKAQYVYQQTGLPALADDTGLEVDALDGRPGVYSARYAGETASAQDNIEKLLVDLAGVERADRTARFRTVLSLFTDAGAETFEGVCEGEILKTPSGSKGFGYDPVFRPLAYEKTFAELDANVKNHISHRGKAIQLFYDWIKEKKF